MLDEVVDYRDLKGVYDECSLLIGTRFHSVIFSLTSNVPCVAIEYEHKTRGIMADLELGDWVLPIAEVTHDKLWTLVEPLLQDPGPYRVLLDKNLPGYVARAQSLPERLREAV